jgi:hypothetical protein
VPVLPPVADDPPLAPEPPEPLFEEPPAEEVPPSGPGTVFTSVPHATPIKERASTEANELTATRRVRMAKNSRHDAF